MDQENYLQLWTAKPAQAQEVFEIFRKETKGRVQLSEKYQKAFLRVLGNSNHLARWTRRFPEQAAYILNQNLNRTWGVEDYLKELKKGPSLQNLQALSKKLVFLKYQQLFRITLGDMGSLKGFVEIAHEISALAESILRYALEYFLTEFYRLEGIPKRNQSDKAAIPFTVLGLGKLGGGELNYSSDVDLIFFYGSDQGKVFLNQKPTSTTPHHFFTKLAENFTKFINQKTSEGFLYRVDLELRPEGKSGALTNSLDAMEHYYETFGASWEKQAMIKASCAAGSEKLYLDFKEIIQPFIYPKFSDFSFLKNLKEMKEKILNSITGSSQKGFHVKLGLGGIREIEFFVQSFQILFGGKTLSLRNQNTLETIKALNKEGFLNKKEENNMMEAYIFLRTLENRLQQIEEQQTHRLPEETSDLEGLARRMGYIQKEPQVALNEMMAHLADHCNFVQTMFEKLLSGKIQSP